MTDSDSKNAQDAQNLLDATACDTPAVGISRQLQNQLAHQSGSAMHSTALGWPEQVSVFTELVATIVRDGAANTAKIPDFNAVRDKRMSELTPAQRDDAHELWLRKNLGWMGSYHAEHYQFLLARLDACRGAGIAAQVDRHEET